MAELSEHRFLVLVGLSKGPSQGRALRAEVLESTGGRVRSTAVSTFHALDALLDLGLVGVDRTEPGRADRWYHLTDLGRERLLHEAKRYRSLADLADEYLGAVDRV